MFMLTPKRGLRVWAGWSITALRGDVHVVLYTDNEGRGVRRQDEGQPGLSPQETGGNRQRDAEASLPGKAGLGIALVVDPSFLRR